jgi:alpha/beta superfamily hydrolase
LKKKNVVIDSGGLRLEACLDLPKEGSSPFPGVVLCHPNPAYGGEMHNNVIMAVTWALTEVGIACLRYNSRGVGNSQGELGGGLPERDDGRAAVSFLAEQPEVDPTRLGIMGYSFGGSIAMPVGEESNLIKVIATVSPVIPAGVLRDCPKPKLVICGDVDNMVLAERILQESEKMSEPKIIKVFPGVDHFWWGYETEAAELVASFISEHLI